MRTGLIILLLGLDEPLCEIELLLTGHNQAGGLPQGRLDSRHLLCERIRPDAEALFGYLSRSGAGAIETVERGTSICHHRSRVLSRYLISAIRGRLGH